MIKPVLILYVSDTLLRLSLIRGGKIKKTIAKSIPRGIIANGLIVNENEFLSIISKLKKEWKSNISSLRIIIDSNAAAFRTLKLPKKMSVNDFQSYMDIEMKNVDSPTNKYIHKTISKKMLDKNNLLFGYSLETEYVQVYINSFVKSGIKIKSIETVASLFIGTVLSNRALSKSIMFFLYNDVLHTFVFDSESVFTSRTRIAYELGTEEFNDALLDNILKLFKSNSVGDIKNSECTFINFSKELYGYISSYIKDVEHKLLPNKLTHELLICNEKEKFRINFVAKEKAESSKKNHFVRNLFILFISVMTILLSGLWGYYQYEQSLHNEESQLQKKYEILNNDKSYLTYKSLFNSNMEMSQINQNMEDVMTYSLKTLYQIDGDILTEIVEIINDSPTVQLNEFFYIRDTQIITLVLSGSTQHSGYGLASKLINKDIFDSVEYLSKYVNLDGTYVITIDLTLKEGE